MIELDFGGAKTLGTISVVIWSIAAARLLVLGTLIKWDTLLFDVLTFDQLLGLAVAVTVYLFIINKTK